MSAKYSDAEREALRQLPEHYSGIFDAPLPPSVEWLEEFRRRIEGSRMMVRSYGHKKSAKWRTEKHLAAIPHALIVATAVEREQRLLAEREARS